jgi:WD40 repeat protein
LQRLNKRQLHSPFIYHVDFTPGEVEEIRRQAREFIGAHPSKKDARRDLARLLRKKPEILTNVPKQLANALPRRSVDAITAYLIDVAKRQNSSEPLLLTLQRDDLDKQSELVHSSRIPSLLFARELVGNRAFGSILRNENLNNEFKKAREDGLELQEEWTNCAGDISTITWVSDTTFLCGTTTHSDAHNQQYNKPGNLLLGSAEWGTLKAYPFHRITRPIVDKGQNASDEMRESQDPWLYSSVVSSDYDSNHKRAFTSSFDRTIKVWALDETGDNSMWHPSHQGESLKHLGTWEHSGNVNFVVASKHHSGMVATAADVPSKAVRVYQVNPDNISNSLYQSYSTSRAGEYEGLDQPIKWAYFPATIRWGLAETVSHLLLVGYSPRSVTGSDGDIPEDKVDSGELSLLDCITGKNLKISAAYSQNVFEVAWHPSQPSFIAATSACGLTVEDGAKTQIRVFHPGKFQSENGEEVDGYLAFICLDCAAADINELTIMPNSILFAYITAAGTDGKVYVWDSARGDKPIHVLRHGEPLEEIYGDRETEDTGVKFTAWGSSPDRFYTGGSDGVVKLWNIRSLSKPLMRDLVEVSGPVSFGAFSSDYSKLAIGDASGRLYLLSLNADDKYREPTSRHTQTWVHQQTRFDQLRLPNGRKPKRIPKTFAPHASPPAPIEDGLVRFEEDLGSVLGRRFLERGYLLRHPNPTIGVVQGPTYGDTGLFRGELHLDGDPSQPLLPAIALQQQINKISHINRIMPPPRPVSSVLFDSIHRRNVARDLDISTLPSETRRALELARVDLQDTVDYELDYEDDDMGDDEM